MLVARYLVVHSDIYGHGATCNPIPDKCHPASLEHWGSKNYLLVWVTHSVSFQPSPYQGYRHATHHTEGGGAGGKVFPSSLYLC